MGRVISGVYDFVRLCVSVCVSELKNEKKLELLTPNLVDIAVAPQLALTLRSKGQRSRSRGYQMRCRRGYACRYRTATVF